jgi:hypothetical protein
MLNRTKRVRRRTDAEVWAHPKAETIYADLRQRFKSHPIAGRFTREQWTRGVREILEGMDGNRCACCGKPLSEDWPHTH